MSNEREEKTEVPEPLYMLRVRSGNPKNCADCDYFDNSGANWCEIWGENIEWPYSTNCNAFCKRGRK